MIYSLNKNIFLVKGATKSCIYDLRSSHARIYWFHNSYLSIRNFANKISKILKENINPKPFLIQTPSYKQKLNFAWIEITSKCNINCQYCYLPNKRNQHITAKEFLHVLHFLIEKDCRKIMLIGGEPFCHPNVLDLIRQAKKYGFEVSLYTNGLLLNESLIKTISKLNISINIGIPSVIFHSTKSAKKLKKNIVLAKKYGILNKVSATITRYNYNYDFKSLLADSFELFKPDLVRINSKSGLKYYNIDLLNKKLITLDTFRAKLESKTITKRFYYHNCFAKRIYISSDLSIFPCPMVRNINLGKLLPNSDISYANLKSLFTLTKDKIFICRYCEFRYACFDCRFEVWGKNPYNRPWYCTYNPFTGKWITAKLYIDKYLKGEENMQDQNIVLLTKDEKEHEVSKTEIFCSPGWCQPVEE